MSYSGPTTMVMDCWQRATRHPTFLRPVLRLLRPAAFLPHRPAAFLPHRPAAFLPHRPTVDLRREEILPRPLFLKRRGPQLPPAPPRLSTPLFRRLWTAPRPNRR